MRTLSPRQLALQAEELRGKTGHSELKKSRGSLPRAASPSGTVLGARDRSRFSGGRLALVSPCERKAFAR